MNILIGCEESQAVTKEFRKLGHEAFSCDLKPCSGGHPEWHIQGDVIEAINGANCQFGQFWTEAGTVEPPIKWDLIGIHPVCTKMTLSGNRTYGKGKDRHQERLDSVEWTISLWELACKHADMVYMENPMGAMNTDPRLPKPQIIQPYFFGDEFQKTTCLWLYNLKPLLHSEADTLFENKTHVAKGEMTTFKSGCVMPKWYADAWKLPEYERKELRSKTFPGIARAMAEQWGNQLIFNHEKTTIQENQ
jgi:hypothetical protein